MLLAGHGYPSLAVEPPATPPQFAARLRGRRLLLATDSLDEPIGFALTERLGRTEWLCELSVHPAHGRRGVGAALVEAVAKAARERGCDQIGLSTFRTVPFNAPFYASHGFVELPPETAGPVLARRFRDEVPPGIDPNERLMMVRMLTRDLHP